MDDFILTITVEETDFIDSELMIDRPNQTIKELIDQLKQICELPNECNYNLARKLRNVCGHELIEMIREDQYERGITDVGIKANDTVFLLKNNPISSSEDEFVIDLSVEGEVTEVVVSDPHRPIREQISRIKSVFGLPEEDCGGNPILYDLYLLRDNDPDGVCLRPEDDNGCELSLLDHGIHPGDRIECVPIAAYACPIPVEMEMLWIEQLPS